MFPVEHGVLPIPEVFCLQDLSACPSQPHSQKPEGSSNQRAWVALGWVGSSASPEQGAGVPTRWVPSGHLQVSTTAQSAKAPDFVQGYEAGGNQVRTGH